jgi:hypothetical protein
MAEDGQGAALTGEVEVAAAFSFKTGEVGFSGGQTTDGWSRRARQPHVHSIRRGRQCGEGEGAQCVGSGGCLFNGVAVRGKWEGGQSCEAPLGEREREGGGGGRADNSEATCGW